VLQPRKAHCNKGIYVSLRISWTGSPDPHNAPKSLETFISE
jgi:hypothetical protein